MVNSKQSKEQFLRNVKNHTMRVEMDDGVHRSLVFSNDDTFNQHFRINTWPGYLCISGDMGCYVFSRIYDMFKFFRSEDNEIEINPGYWAEKLQAHDHFGGYREFSKDSFDEDILEKVREQCEEEDHPLTDRIIVAMCDKLSDVGESHECCMQFVNDFSVDDLQDTLSIITTNDEDEILDRAGMPNINFIDYWESMRSHYSPTYHYLWCLYAIVWAIGVYDG